MFNPFYALLLPVTTVVDYLLTPRRVRKKEFYADVKFFVGGVHATAWPKVMVPLCVVGFYLLLEPTMDEITLWQNQAVRAGRDFHFYSDMWRKLDGGRADVDSFAVYAVLLMLLCVCSFPWLAFFAIVRQPCMLIPYQLACLWTISRLYGTAAEYYVAGISGIVHKYLHAEDYLGEDFDDTWDDYVKVLGEVRLERSLAPILRNGMFAALIFFVLVVEYTVERAMEHYGYKRLLDKLVTLSTYQWLRSRGIEQCGRLRARSTEQWGRLCTRSMQHYERVRARWGDANGNEKPAQSGDCPYDGRGGRHSDDGGAKSRQCAPRAILAFPYFH